MRTPEEITNQYFNGTREEVGEEPFDQCIEMVKQIQTESFDAGVKKGMLDASSISLRTIPNPKSLALRRLPESIYDLAAIDIKNAILSATEKL